MSSQANESKVSLHNISNISEKYKNIFGDVNGSFGTKTVEGSNLNFNSANKNTMINDSEYKSGIGNSLYNQSNSNIANKNTMLNSNLNTYQRKKNSNDSKKDRNIPVYNANDSKEKAKENLISNNYTVNKKLLNTVTDNNNISYNSNYASKGSGGNRFKNLEAFILPKFTNNNTNNNNDKVKDLSPDLNLNNNLNISNNFSNNNKSVNTNNISQFTFSGNKESNENLSSGIYSKSNEAKKDSNNIVPVKKDKNSNYPLFNFNKNRVDLVNTGSSSLDDNLNNNHNYNNPMLTSKQSRVSNKPEADNDKLQNLLKKVEKNKVSNNNTNNVNNINNANSNYTKDEKYQVVSSIGDLIDINQPLIVSKEENEFETDRTNQIFNLNNTEKNDINNDKQLEYEPSTRYIYNSKNSDNNNNEYEDMVNIESKSREKVNKNTSKYLNTNNRDNSKQNANLNNKRVIIPTVTNRINNKSNEKNKENSNDNDNEKDIYFDNKINSYNATPSLISLKKEKVSNSNNNSKSNINNASKSNINNNNTNNKINNTVNNESSNIKQINLPFGFGVDTSRSESLNELNQVKNLMNVTSYKNKSIQVKETKEIKNNTKQIHEINSFTSNDNKGVDESFSPNIKSQLDNFNREFNDKGHVIFNNTDGSNNNNTNTRNNNNNNNINTSNISNVSNNTITQSNNPGFNVPSTSIPTNLNNVNNLTRNQDSHINFFDNRIKLLEDFNNDLGHKIKALKTKLNKVPKIKCSVKTFLGTKMRNFECIVSFLDNSDNSTLYSSCKDFKEKYFQMLKMKCSNILSLFSVKYKNCFKIEKSSIVVNRYYKSKQNQQDNISSKFLN